MLREDSLAVPLLQPLCTAGKEPPTVDFDQDLLPYGADGNREATLWLYSLVLSVPKTENTLQSSSVRQSHDTSSTANLHPTELKDTIVYKILGGEPVRSYVLANFRHAVT